MTATELYIIALENKAKGEDSRAAAVFTQIISEYPESEEAKNSKEILDRLDVSEFSNEGDIGSKIITDNKNIEKIIKEAELRADAKKAGYVGATISSILAILSIFILGIVFLPIAILIAIFSTFNAIKNKNISGILYNLLAWILITIGSVTSPAFLALVGGIFVFSSNDYNYNEVTEYIPSKLAPDFDLPRLYKKNQQISNKTMKGKVWVMNAFSSGCDVCSAENIVLTNFSDKYKVPIIGLYKDYGNDGNNVFDKLEKYGNPYTAIAIDSRGLTGIAYDVYGHPESFVIDKKGMLRYKLSAPISESMVVEKLVPIILKLREEPD